MSHSRRRLVSLGMAGLVTPLLISGCVTGPKLQDDSSVLLERARTYWAATVANDQIAAWPFEDASVNPRWTLQAYLKRGGIVYEDAVVKGIQSLDGDKALVEVEVRFNLPQIRLRNHVSTISDRWQRINGVWLHVLSRNSLFEQPK